MISNIPDHVALVMDGNVRWARSAGLQPIFGYRAGADAAVSVILRAAQLGIRYLTLYVFSSENWFRPVQDVASVYLLMDFCLSNFVSFFFSNNLIVRFIGDFSGFPIRMRKHFEEIEYMTARNSGTVLTLAIGYGAVQDLISAFCLFKGADIDVSCMDYRELVRVCYGFLSTGYLPDVDLLIRSGKEKRLSNFLLWQCSYAELYFCEVLWPDFTVDDFDAALVDYSRRGRRYGYR